MAEKTTNKEFLFYLLLTFYLYIFDEYHRNENNKTELKGSQYRNETFNELQMCPKEAKRIRKVKMNLFDFVLGDFMEFTDMLVYFAAYLVLNQFVLEPYCGDREEKEIADKKYKKKREFF